MQLPTPPNVSRRTFGLTALGIAAAAAVPVLRRDEDAPGGLALRGASTGESGTTAETAASSATSPTDGPAPDMPEIVARTTWDPDGECWIEPGPRTRPARIHVHHTSIPVATTPEEVPGVLQSICRSHHERGFGGIGYHYAVDPFGRTWQGRGAPLDELPERVRNGAHAQGFNDNSLGVVLIGDYEAGPPSTDAQVALERLLAYLAWRYDIDPHDTVRARSSGGGATRYAAGETVTLPAICGHRDTGSGTLCPGERLYTRLPLVREGVLRRLELAGA